MSAHKSTFKLREQIHDQKLEFLQEDLINDAGKFYEILILKNSGHGPFIPKYGHDIWTKGDTSEAYRRFVLNRLKNSPIERNRCICKYLETIL